MKSEDVQTNERLFFLPSQVIQIGTTAIIRRGATKVEVRGDDAFDIIKIIMVLASEDGATQDEIIRYFDSGLSEQVKSLVDDLIERGLLVSQKPGKKSNGDDNSRRSTKLDVFWWNLGVSAEAREKLATTRFRIMGVNLISHQISKVFDECGMTNYEVLDYPLLRNTDFFGDDGSIRTWESARAPKSYAQWVEQAQFDQFDCLIATSDFGGMYMLRDFNEFCVENGIAFLPVVLQDLNGFVGPLVIPHDTCCYECFLQRQNSNLPDYETKRSIEYSDHEGQQVIGFHPAMAYVLADIAAFELVKFFGGIVQSRNVGKLIHVNLLSTQMKTSPVYKMPRCPICGSTSRSSTTTIYKSVFLPTHNE